MDEIWNSGLKIEMIMDSSTINPYDPKILL